MAIRVVSAGTTLIKRITVGTPTQIGNASTGRLANLDDVSTTGLANGYNLRWDSDNSKFQVYNFDSDVKNLIQSQSPIDYTPATGTVSLITSGAVAGDYGGSNSVPTIRVNAYGLVDSISEVSVAGVSAFTFDSSIATLNISTADGGSFNARIGLSSFNTGDLSEGSNQYFTQARARSSISLSNDSDLFSYDSSTGVITIIDSAIARSDYLDTFREGLQIADEKKINFIDSIGNITADIFENNNNFFVRKNNLGMGGIYISAADSNSVYINNYSGDRTLGKFTDKAGVDLYYNNSLKLSTLDTGAKVTGDLTVTVDTYLLGNLTVQGTTTTINSTTLSVNDKNLVLADSAADSNAANGAGITIAGANATIIYSSSTDTWDLNKPLGNTVNHLSNFSTTNLTEGTNLYYTDARFDSGFSSKTTDNLTEGSNLYYTTARADSAFDIRLATKTTANLTEGSNLYYTRARFDSALGDTTSTSTIRGMISASGDLTYDSSTGQFSFDVESVYTQANFDSDFNTSLDAAAIGGIGLGYNSTTNTLSIDSAELASYYSTDNITEGSNLYFTDARVDASIVDKVLSENFTIKDSAYLDIMELTGIVISGQKTAYFDTLKDSHSILFSTNTFGIASKSGNELLRTNSDSDRIELKWGGSKKFETRDFGVKYYGSLRGDSAQIGLVTGDFDRSANTTVTAGTYGSASLVPVFTVDSSGFIDSAGTVSVAGVSSVSFDSATYNYTISTADGGTYPQMIHTRMGGAAGTYGSASLVPIISVNQFGLVDSVSSVSVAGVSTFTFDSSNATLNIGTADGGSFNARLGLQYFSTSDLSEGTNLYYTTARADSDATSLTSGGTLNPVFNSITNNTGKITSTPSEVSVSDGTITTIDNVAHNSDFMSIEYVVHLDDSDNNHSQISKVLATYNKSTVNFTEYGMVNSFTNDSDMGAFTVDEDGGNIRLRFTRSSGLGTIKVKPNKNIIS